MTHGTETDKECFKYVVDQEAGASQKSFQERFLRDCLHDGTLHPDRRAPNGRGMCIKDFLHHPDVRRARLSLEEVIALRVYTTAVFVSINQPLRDRARVLILVPTRCTRATHSTSACNSTFASTLICTCNYALFDIHATHC